MLPNDYEPDPARLARRNALATFTTGGTGQPAPMRQAYYNYLQGQGYTGAMGPDMHAFADSLRGQGEHPWMAFRRSAGYPGGPMGARAGQAGPHGGFLPPNYEPPRPFPGSATYGGQNALASFGGMPHAVSMVRRG